MTSTRQHRQAADRRGRWAEWLATLFLMVKGYWPVARRLKTPVGEIDLLVRRGDILAVIEVKARADLGQAAESISDRQWQRIARALEWYIAGRPALADRNFRFDALLVAGLRVRHVPDAWRPK